MANKNTLTVGYKETKDVLLLIIGLGRAYEQIRADGKVNYADLVHLLPILFLIGPAIEGFDNVQLELKMATPEEGDELKAWVKEQVDLKDKSVEEFVEAAFAVILDIWMVFRTFFFPGEENLLKKPEVPDNGPSVKLEEEIKEAIDNDPIATEAYDKVTGNVPKENMDGVPVDLATPTSE